MMSRGSGASSPNLSYLYVIIEQLLDKMGIMDDLALS
jgi:hypothetical protein